LGGVDTMQWPLTAAQYGSVLSNTNLIVEPLSESGEFEMAFNNNYTDGVLPGVEGGVVDTSNRRSPTNFTDFRNAMNLLIDKAGVIAGSILGGFATQSDTQVPTPLMASYVNTAVSGANYPWKFDVPRALQILYTDGWYNPAIYLTYASLLQAFNNGSLATAGGTVKGVVYSGNDPNGQWGGGDPKATANAFLANTPLQPLIGFVRSGDGRKDLGDFFVNELTAIGCPFVENYKATLTALKPFVMTAQHYNFATLGYSFGAPPNWWWTELTPAGIYSDGPNPYMVDDANTTFYAHAAFTDSNPTTFDADQKIVQYNLVMESFFVPAYCPATYCAYKTGLLAQIDILGQATQANGAQWENWIMLNSRKTSPLGTTINWPNFTNVPDSNIVYIGVYNPPDMLNPMFQDTVFDFQVTDEIFTYPIGGNPYTITPGSAIANTPPSPQQGNDLPWMAYSWKQETVANPGGVDGARYPGPWSNITLWLRNDIYWHDGVKFTPADLNYTIYINALYGDSWVNGAMVWAVNNTGPYGNTTGATMRPYFSDNVAMNNPDPMVCSVLVKSESWLNLYLPWYATVPEHLYKYIVPANKQDAIDGLDIASLHGLWPGQAANASNFLTVPPGAPGDAPYITFGNVSTQGGGKPDYTLIGTGPFKYRAGSTSTADFAPGGAITLDAYDKFFMPIAPGAVAFQYTWLNTAQSAQPSGGYYKVGLVDFVYLAHAYLTTGTPPSVVPITAVPGAPHTWNPGCDLAGPSGGVSLTDLVTLATHYGWYYGNYSYNAPYPPAELANGGP